jgi:hypothetical protein
MMQVSSCNKYVFIMVRGSGEEKTRSLEEIQRVLLLKLRVLWIVITLIINNNPKSCYRGHTYDANTNKCTYNATCPSNYILVNNTCMSNDSSLARLSITPQQVRSIRDQS